MHNDSVNDDRVVVVFRMITHRLEGSIKSDELYEQGRLDGAG